jgi:hypothetical protein
MSEAESSDAAIRTWTRDRACVFSDRARELGASDLDGVEPEDRMAIVEVDNVALAPRDVGDLRGEMITGYLEATDRDGVGQAVTFFDRSWQNV